MSFLSSRKWPPSIVLSCGRLRELTCKQPALVMTTFLNFRGGRLRELNSTVDGKTLGYFTVLTLLLLLLLILLLLWNITYCSEFLNKDLLLLLLLLFIIIIIIIIIITTLLHITTPEKYMRTTRAVGLNDLRSAKKREEFTWIKEGFNL